MGHTTESSFEITPLKDTPAFKPIKVGSNTLEHRIVFAPTTRMRALEDHTPSDLQLDYYDARTKIPGSLVITEATHMNPHAGLYKWSPGIWSEKHAAAWKKVVDKVHENKSFISIQLWALGRAADPAYLKELGLDLISSSPLHFSEEQQKATEDAGVVFRALTTEEVKDFIFKYYTNAVEKAKSAGFDYIELHNAHGYLLDQFLQSSSNQRTDQYGGSIENRARFVLELIDHLLTIVDPSKLGIRLSPWAQFQAMKGKDNDIHPYAQFGYLIKELQKRADNGKGLAYISLVEPRSWVFKDVVPEKYTGNNDFVYDIWKGPVIRSGNYSYDAPEYKGLRDDVANDRTLVGFARYYTSNPDLPDRLKNGLNLIPYDRDVFYRQDNYGYNTYPRYGETVKVDEEKEKLHKPTEIK